MSRADLHSATPEGDDPLEAKAVGALRAHPQFQQLTKRIAQSFVDLFEGNRFLNLISNDRGRMQVGHAVLYLHVTRDPNDPSSGLTPSRLKAFCAEHRMSSPGRTAAMLAVMQMAGHVVEAPAIKDKRFRILMPTSKLLETFRSRWIAAFDMLAILDPDSTDIAKAVRERDDFVQAYIRVLVESYIGGHRFLNKTPELSVFADANAGVLILLSLFLAGEDGNAPDGGQYAHIPISTLARRFGVSRPHVKQVLRNAQDRGLLTVEADGIFLTRRLIEATLGFFANMLALERHSGRRALALSDRRETQM